MDAAKSLRVLEIVQSLGKGGRTTRFIDTVNELRKMQCYILPLSLTTPAKWINISGLEVIQRKNGIDWPLILNIRKIIKKQNINIVHAHCELSQLYTGLATLGLKIAVVGTFHRSDIKKYSASINNTLIKLMMKKFVAVSCSRLNLLTNNLKYPSPHCHVIHGGTAVTAMPNSEQILATRAKLKIASEQVALVSAGHLGKIKGHQDTITALAKCIETFPNIHLYIAGDGEQEEKNRLKKQIEKYNLNEKITLLGQVNNVKEWLTACDIFIQPSIDEAFGLVFIEAGAQAKPVISTSVGGIKEIVVNNETGLLVSPSSPKDLYLAISKLIESPLLRKQMGEQGYNRVKNKFSLENMAQQYVSIFTQIIAQSHEVINWKK